MRDPRAARGVRRVPLGPRPDVSPGPVGYSASARVGERSSPASAGKSSVSASHAVGERRRRGGGRAGIGRGLRSRLLPLCSIDVARHLVALVDLVGDLEEDEQHDDHLDQHQVRHEQALDRLVQHEQLVHEAGMRASFFIDGMPMKSLKALLSFILRVLCSGMGGRAGQAARALASSTRTDSLIPHRPQGA